jgi:hypothetical protein
MRKSYFEETVEPNSICFPIEKVPMYHQYNGDLSPSAYNAIIRSDTGQELYVGKRYEPINNQHIIDTMEQFGAFQLHKILNYSNKRFELRYDMPVSQFHFFTEPTMMQIVIRNSYDGSHSLKVNAGLRVLTCSNGANIPIWVKEFNFRHTNIDIIRRFSEFMNNQGQLLQDIGDQLSGKIWNSDFNHDTVAEKYKSILPQQQQKEETGIILTAIEGHYNKYNEKYENREFASFMALTEVSSRPKEYVLCNSWHERLDRLITNTYFNQLEEAA